MRTSSKPLLLTVALGAIVSAVGVQPAHAQQPVVVTNTIETPVPVQNVQHPALQPYQGTATITTDSNGNEAITNFTPSPQGGRLVIEYVSAACSTNLDTRIIQLGIKTTIGNLTVNHNVAPVLLPSPPNSRRYIVGQPTRLYHDTNTSLGPFRVVNIIAFGQKVLNCSFTVSGHIVSPSI